MYRIISICLAFGFLIAISGCETIKGVGRDITNAGEALEDSVR